MTLPGNRKQNWNHWRISARQQPGKSEASGDPMCCTYAQGFAPPSTCPGRHRQLPVRNVNTVALQQSLCFPRQPGMSVQQRRQCCVPVQFRRQQNLRNKKRKKAIGRHHFVLFFQYLGVYRCLLEFAAWEVSTKHND
eukprot:825962-Amphidinium_carterae.1